MWIEGGEGGGKLMGEGRKEGGEGDREGSRGGRKHSGKREIPNDIQRGKGPPFYTLTSSVMG